MANYDAFVFEGHGKSEKNGGFDSGAVNGNITENSLADKIVKSAKKYLDKTPLIIHYDENNFQDLDLKGNNYKYKFGISVHINSSIGASGTEIFVPNGEDFLNSDFAIVDEISKLLKIPNRGVKSRNYDTGLTTKRTNGVKLSGTDYYGEIREAWNLGISLAILEVGFIQEDLTEIQNNIDKIGYLVAEYIAENCNTTIPMPVPPTTTPLPPTTDKELYYRVVVGSFKDRDNAEIIKDKAIEKGFTDAFIVTFEK